jgi:hypothetical protein
MRAIVYIFCFVTIILPSKLIAQSSNQNSGWTALFHSQKFNNKIGAHFDFQVRSADDFDYVRNILIRPGITWFIDGNKNATLGYALILTNQRLEGAANDQLTESRIWEQFIFNQKIGKIPLAHRFRLEQRFIETPLEDVFSNRIRYFIRSVIPLTPQEDKFNTGLFMALQNEVFLNLQNKDKLNGHIFDQNRAYAALGYRLSPKMDIEAGYLNQAIKGRSSNTANHAVQVAFYTRF